MTATSAATGYQALLDKLNGVLDANFSAQVPPVTKRSGGLDPQCGLVIGLGADDRTTSRLVASLGRLPEVWSRYDDSTLHLTLGACEDRTTDDIAEPLADGRTMEERYEGLTQPLLTRRNIVSALDSDGLHLANTRVLFSGDTIVLTGVPSLGLYEARELLTGDEAAQIAGIRPGWGAHFTLARATRPLTDNERTATNAWVGDICLPSVVDLSKVIAGAFSVANNRFRFARHCATELKEE